MNCAKFLYSVLISFLLGWSFMLSGQNSTISGKVQLKGSTDVVSGVYVFLDNTNYGTITNSNGKYQIQNVPAGDYTLVVSSIGYLTLQKAIQIETGESLSFDLEVEETIMGLPAVVVQSVSLTGGMRGLRSIPGSAHYISPREIEKLSYTDVNRVLRTVPGVNLQEEDGFGLRPNIGLRGAGSERSSKITLMEDGVLAAPAPYAAPSAYHFPTIGRIQAVEIMKGSSQVRFGPYTTGGAINLLSTAIPGHFSGKVNILGGNYGNRNLHVYVGSSHKNFGYLVESFQLKSNGFKQLDNGGETGFDKKDYLAKFRVNTGPNARIYQSLTFKIGQSQENSDETYLGLTQDDFNQNPYRRYSASQKDGLKTSHEQYSLQHIAMLTNSIDITTTAYRNNFFRNWYKLDKVKDAAGKSYNLGSLLADPSQSPEAYGILTGATSVHSNALLLKANYRTYISQGVQTVMSLRMNTNKIQHTLDIGLRYHADEMDRFQWEDGYKMTTGTMSLSTPGVGGTESNRIDSGKAWATYAQYKVKIGSWTFVPGLRYENIVMERMDYGTKDPERSGENLTVKSNKVDVFIPGMGINYKFNESLNVFGGVHKGFSPPGSTEGSKPEESVSYELGTRYRNGALSGQAVVFYNDYKNLLGADLAAVGGTGSADMFNGGKVKAKGLEFQMSYDLMTEKGNTWSLPLTLVYTNTSAAFQSDFASTFAAWGQVKHGDELPYIARHQLALMLSAGNDKFNVNLNTRYQNPMRAVAGQGEILESERVDGFFLVDVNASYKVHSKVNLFGSITNLTDEVYIAAHRPAGLRPGLPRAFMAGMKVNF